MKWANLFGVNQNDFIRQFQDNERLFNQAKHFWNNDLETAMLVVFIVSLCIGIVCAWLYYVPFNNKPGRHYHWKYLLVWMLVAVVGTLFISFGLEYIIAEPKLNGAWGVESKIAIISAGYSLLAYVITSVIWCNCGRTNAYRFLKF